MIIGPLTKSRIATGLILLLLAAAVPALAIQEIKETQTITKILRDNLGRTKTIFRTSHEMMEQAQPFTRERHRDRYRFAPSDRFCREVLTISRSMSKDYHIMMGILSHAPLPDRDVLLKSMVEITDAMATFAKRSLRAIRDGNFALYLASAQGLEKEAAEMDLKIRKLEDAINASIEASDAMKEDL